ncbi:MAG: thioredoxin [Planctomycetota bacterium]|nr:thioredoxin [Planctomycetota bacterium]
MADLELKPASDSVVAGTEENFEQVALARSNDVAVVIDFWAEWCEPCRQIAPILEKIVNESAGNIALVKVNVEEQPRLASYFQVQSIPAVFVLRNGQIVDNFTGVQPESALRAWLGQFLPSPAEQLVAEARSLEGSDPTAAEAKYHEALELMPQEDGLRIALARLLSKQHRNQDSRAIIDQLEKRGFLEPEAQLVKDELDLRALAAEAGGVGECRAAVAANPEDPTLQVHLADALGAAQQYEEALEICLKVVQQATGDPREHARSTMVKLFHLLGPEAELARTYRRKLATALY